LETNFQLTLRKPRSYYRGNVAKVVISEFEKTGFLAQEAEIVDELPFLA
jgi:hypothetical protein